MKIKLGISLILAFLVFVFITQNTESVSVVFMVWSTEMSLVLLVFITLVFGVVIGWLANSYLRYMRLRTQQQHHKTVIATQAESTGSPKQPVAEQKGDETAQ